MTIVKKTRGRASVGAVDRYLEVQHVATHYLEDGPTDAATVVLLHGGSWGEAARPAWYSVIDGLADHGLHVVAPDWLGFGETAKLRDFGDLAGRMIDHIAELLRALRVNDAAAVGLSMGGSHLLRALTTGPKLPVSRLVLVSAGGAPIDKSAGAALMDYDGSDDAMRVQIRLAVNREEIAHDAGYLRMRQDEAHRPGHYEFFRSLQLRAPWAAPPARDPIPYESVAVPTLVLAGAEDVLKPRGFSADVAARIPGAQHHVVADAGHCLQLDAPGEFTNLVARFVCG